MKVDLFDFELPDELIAQEPVDPRDSARLLHVSGDIFDDKTIRDLPELLGEGDLLVFNNTKVIPARLKGTRRGSSVEVTLHKNIGSSRWLAFAKPAKKLKAEDQFDVAEGFNAKVIRKLEGGEVELEFNLKNEQFDQAIVKHGIMPLPPYIQRKTGAKTEDVENYQTIYAKKAGAVAAPTAGLHFTDEMFNAFETKGIKHCFVTLHVGAGTFLPVKSENTEEHVMHSEYYEIDEETAKLINETKKTGGRIICVGTTSLRTLESAANDERIVKAGSAETEIFITPGYKFKIMDLLLTNFHLPRSTLFMLVCSIVGIEQMQKAYAHAISSNYRFYSYGDACLLEKNDI